MRKPTLPPGTTNACARACATSITLVLSLAVSTTIRAEELVVNGEFDEDLSGWSLESGTAVSAGTDAQWDADDLAAASDSGAMRLTSAEPAANARPALARQCVQLNHTGHYRLSVWGKASQPGAGYLVPMYWLRYDNTCVGGGNVVGGWFLAGDAGWDYFEQNIIVREAPAKFEIVLGIEKSAAGGSFSGVLDAVSFFDTQRLHIDGFE